MTISAPRLQVQSSAWLTLVVVPTALAFSAWAFALSQMNAGKLSIATYLVPPTAILMSWIVLGEVPAALAFVGGAVCLVGCRSVAAHPQSLLAPRNAPFASGSAWVRRRREPDVRHAHYHPLIAFHRQRHDLASVGIFYRAH
ncbi:MAG: DMT family transporter [Nocardioidaceae bacterium]